MEISMELHLVLVLGASHDVKNLCRFCRLLDPSRGLDATETALIFCDTQAFRDFFDACRKSWILMGFALMCQF